MQFMINPIISDQNLKKKSKSVRNNITVQNTCGGTMMQAIPMCLYGPRNCRTLYSVCCIALLRIRKTDNPKTIAPTM